MLYTPYTPGDPVGSYGIYARSGYYSSTGEWLGEVADTPAGYVDGGNYVIDGDDPLTLDVDGVKYVKIGSFKVTASTTPDSPVKPEEPAEPGYPPPDRQPPLTASSEPEPDGNSGVFVNEHIKYLYGYPDGLVKPEKNLSRAEASAVFFRLLSDSYRSGVIKHTNAFPDVAPEDWFNTEVSTLSGIGIVLGGVDGLFRPNSQITRAEVSAMAVRFADIMGETGSGSAEFSDVSGHWAERDIYRAAEIGWIVGYPDGSFGPDDPITRAEFVTLVNRMLRRAPETIDDLLSETMKIWPDNTPDKWYYLDIQEATNAHEYVRKDKRVPNRDFNYERWTAIIEAPDTPPDEP
jgi:hypothetical protein